MYYIFLFTFDPLSLFPCTPGNHQSVPWSMTVFSC